MSEDLLQENVKILINLEGHRTAQSSFWKEYYRKRLIEIINPKYGHDDEDIIAVVLEYMFICNTEKPSLDTVGKLVADYAPKPRKK